MIPAKPAKPLRYHLRYQIIPGPRVERDAKLLADFCRKHEIEEVALFFAGEEWNNGLLSAADENLWFNTVAAAKAVLEKANITVSLNPWMTVLHGAKGRRFPTDRKFQPMVSPKGEASAAVASFADPAWREYIFNLYGRFAKLGFRVIWIEDDFRYHNHKPLTWGGGFEPQMIKRFSKRIGRKVSREELVRNILKPGEPHPWREKWMAVWREAKLEVANGLRKAVASNAPRPVEMGLMSSRPSAHSIEGRDWKRLFSSLSIGNRISHRPHFVSYSEPLGRHNTYPIAMLELQRHFRPKNCEVSPEIENFYYTRWTKSDTATWAEMALAMFFGSDSLFLNLFPFTGNPITRTPGVGELLDKSRPALRWISARFGKDLQPEGVGAPWKTNAAATVRVSKGESLDELEVEPFDAHDFLLPYGIPVCSELQKVNCLFGNLAWAFSDAEIVEMLSRGLMIDARAAEILCKRGFSSDIGVAFLRWENRIKNNYSLEEIVSRESGLESGHLLTANLGFGIARLKALPGAAAWSKIITPTRDYVGAATIAFRNRLGGRVFTYAYPNPQRLPRDYHRQTLHQNAIKFVSGGSFNSALVTGGPYLMPIVLKNSKKRFIVIYNGGTDPAKPTVELPNQPKRLPRATLLAPLKKPAAARLRADGTRISSLTSVPYMGFLVIEEPLS